jgi:hypothetical protein
MGYKIKGNILQSSSVYEDRTEISEKSFLLNMNTKV